MKKTPKSKMGKSSKMMMTENKMVKMMNKEKMGNMRKMKT